MVQGIPPHGHCEICGTPVEVGTRRCGSADCERRFQESIKAKKRGMWMFVLLIFLVMVFSVLGRSYF